MKRVIGLILIALVFSTAQAQSWFGLRSGYPLGATLHYGVKNALANNFDLRVSANLKVRGNDVSFGVGVDALNLVAVEPPFTVYAGGGPAIDFGGDGALVGIHGLLGGEFRFTDLGLDPLGIFAEISLGAGVGIGRPSVIPIFGGAVGFNYHF